ncbi:MAG: hypothetical protein GKR94_09600 [Gammaproteobacteria bacterium]|nr:hypothetical protein [Gammaproteobacteria bacterium]
MLTVVTQALDSAAVTHAQWRGWDGARSAVVTVIQRLGSALNLNVPLPMLVAHGAWTFADGSAHFHRAPGVRRRSECVPALRGGATSAGREHKARCHPCHPWPHRTKGKPAGRRGAVNSSDESIRCARLKSFRDAQVL